MSTEVVSADSLWAVVETLQALLDTREGMDASDPNFPAISREIDDQIEAVVRKVDGVHAYRAHALAMAARTDLMQQAYLNARLAWERTLGELDKYVTAVMERDSKKELAGKDGIKIKLKAKPTSVVIYDEFQIPASYRDVKQPPPVESISKARIAKDLKAGIDVPGADLNIGGTRVDWGDGPSKLKKGAEPEVLEGE